MESSARYGKTASAGVPGLSAAAGRQPASRMRRIVSAGSPSDSRWKVMESAPAFAKSAMYCWGRRIIRCTSKGTAVYGRMAAMTGAPKVRFGTKLPSITSRWIRSAPAWSIRRVSSPIRAKSDESMDGAIFIMVQDPPLSKKSSANKKDLPTAFPAPGLLSRPAGEKRRDRRHFACRMGFQLFPVLLWKTGWLCFFRSGTGLRFVRSVRPRPSATHGFSCTGRAGRARLRRRLPPPASSPLPPDLLPIVQESPKNCNRPCGQQFADLRSAIRAAAGEPAAGLGGKGRRFCGRSRKSALLVARAAAPVV